MTCAGQPPPLPPREVWRLFNFYLAAAAGDELPSVALILSRNFPQATRLVDFNQRLAQGLQQVGEESCLRLDCGITVSRP